MRHFKKSMAIMLALSMVLGGAAETPVNAAQKRGAAKVQSISIQKPNTSTLVLKKKAKYQLKTKVTVQGGISKKVTYKSSNSKIVKVSTKGKLTAKKKGTAKVTVKSAANPSKKAILTVKVGTPVKKVKLSASELTGEVGTSKTLKVAVSPKKATVTKVKFTSSNKKTASVSSKGKVTFLKKGTSNITAKAQDGSGKKAVCRVTVFEFEEEPTATPIPTESAAPTDTPIPSESTTPTEPTAPTESTVPTETPIATKTPAPTITPSTPPASTNSPSSSGSGAGSGSGSGTVIVSKPTATPTGDIDYSQYELKWQDEFEGDTLNKDDWNVEVHEPGWVNAELQKYVDSDDNIYVKDGKLEIKPIQIKNADGSYSYTSGRINTQNEHTYTYGLFEARVKVPTGTGYLPAFWMMPNDENLYGQWPRCGEIDIMEVMGQTTNKVYNTIHYGNPHKENQGTYITENTTFADDYHTFSAEWLPGEIIWYVDGVKSFSTKDWHSTTVGQGTITYPAPFDQPFYMILNLAIGGSWTGDPDDETFESQNYSVEYVKAWQKKDGYDDSNVTKPSKDVVLRAPDANDNYINNGNFAAAEDLTDEKDWQFLTANDGKATAEIKDNAIHITTTNAGQNDYSVQLVQPNLPMKKGATYKVSYDAYADEARKMMSKVSAPDNGWAVYGGGDIVDLTTEKKTYTYEFRIISDDDANGRLEFNMGAYGSTAGIHISNVKVKQTAYEAITEDENKTVLADGNYIYNANFQEGDKRLGFWDIQKDDGTAISVTDLADGRRLKVEASAETSKTKPVVISQSELALKEGNYAFSFDVEGEAGKKITVNVAGVEKEVTLEGGKQSYNTKITLGSTKKTYNNKLVLKGLAETTLTFTIADPGIYYLDNIRLVEDSLIKNGSFDAGFAGYESYVDGSASASNVVDSLTEDNAADFTINDTGDADWKIQLKQNNVELEKGEWYRLSLQAKSSIDRKLMYAIQRDGSTHKDAAGNQDWTPYVQETVGLTGEWQTFTAEFQMKENTDPKSILSISMGAVGGMQITEQHRICIDNINLEKIEAPEMPEIPAGENLLKNADFSSKKDSWEGEITSPATGTESYENNKAVFEITNVGDADWHVQLKQMGLTLEEDCNYTAKFKVTSTAARTIKCAIMSASYTWYGGEDIVLEANTEKEVVVPFTMNAATDTNAGLFLSMGKITDTDTPTSTITLSDFSLVKNPAAEGEPEENLLKDGNFASGKGAWTDYIAKDNGADGDVSYENGKATFNISNVGTANWHIQLKQSGITLEKDSSYVIKFKATSTVARTIELAMQHATDFENGYYGGSNFNLEAEKETEIEYTLTMEKDTDTAADFIVSLGKVGDGDTPASTVTLSDFSLVKVP